MTNLFMPVSIKKDTLKRLHEFSHQGEKHDNLINRLIDICETENRKINIEEETMERLFKITGCRDVNDALNEIMDKCRLIIRKNK